MLEHRKEIYDFIRKYFTEKGFEIGLNTSLIEEGILDSMEIVDFILALEKFSQVEYEPESFEVRNFKSISNLLDNLIQAE